MRTCAFCAFFGYKSYFTNKIIKIIIYIVKKDNKNVKKMKKVSFLKFRAKKRTFLKLETYPCTESGHQGARKWPPWCPEIPNNWRRTHIPFFARNFWKKYWRRTHIFLKVFLKKNEKNENNNILKNVGSVHRFEKK